MTAARRSGPTRRPAPAARARSGQQRRPGAAYPAGVPTVAQPPPLQARRARGILAGLTMFALGFAVAGLLVTAALGGTPAYWILVSVGLLGVGVVGAFSPRGVVEVARPPAWSRRGLAELSEPLGLPARGVTITFYSLVIVGVVGNLLMPAFVRRH